jgi:Recombination endonuclease VII
MPRPKGWRDANIEKARANERAYYHRNKEKCIERSKTYQLRTKYGITPEQRDEMLAAQNFRCAICNDDAPGGPGTWHVDHCHDTGNVRGLLCTRCNTGLGQFRDNTDFPAKAISYLKSDRDKNDARRAEGSV